MDFSVLSRDFLPLVRQEQEVREALCENSSKRNGGERGFWFPLNFLVCDLCGHVFSGFSLFFSTGSISDKYKTTGVIRMSSGKSRNLRIHELPVGKWTEPYREKLIQMEEKSTFVKKFQEHFTDRRAQFEVKLTAKARALLFPNQAVEKFELERVLPNRFYLLDFRGNVRSYRGTSDVSEAMSSLLTTLPFLPEYFPFCSHFVCLPLSARLFLLFVVCRSEN